MPEDVTGKVAALEVYIKNHAERLKEVSANVEDLYDKHDSHEKEYREVLLQLQGICSEFSEFSVKLKEFDSALGPIPKTLEDHMTECKNYRDNDGFFKFWKNNPMIAGEYVFAGVVIALIIIGASQTSFGLSVIKFLLGLVNIGT